MKKPSAFTVKAIGLCAAIWTIRAIFEIINKTYLGSRLWYALSIACAVLWILAFVVMYLKYRKNTESKNTESDEK